MIGFVGTDEDYVKQASVRFLEMLKRAASGSYGDLPLRVLGPSPAQISKVMGKYRYKLIIKCRLSSRFRELISHLLREIGGKKEFREVTAYADINPTGG